MKSIGRVLLTGSSGFIGRHLHERLEEIDIDVVTFDRPAKDIRKWEDLKNISVDLVYHLAAVTYVPFSFENPKITYETNVLGTLNVLELCRQMNIGGVVYTSAYVYGTPKYLPIDEEHPVNSINPYMHSKLIGEELCRSYHDNYGINCTVFRPFNVYGEGQHDSFLIPTILKQAQTGEIVLENPDPRRDFLYVGDLVDAYVKGMKQKSNFEIYNLGYGKSYSVREIVDMVVKISGRRIDWRYTGEVRKSEISDVVADVKKIKGELGWTPKTELYDWLKLMIDKKPS
jgi:UDP-glucose 4-epimerase